MSRWFFAAILTLAFGSAVLPGEPEKIELEGYAEWRSGELLIVDGQRVLPRDGMKFEGKAGARSFASIPVGYEVKVEGRRAPDGSVLADRVEAKPNGVAWLERDIAREFDEIEDSWRRAGCVFEEEPEEPAEPAEDDEPDETLGALHESGPDVERVRSITRKLLPPYVDPEDFRVYVVDNEEWNAMAGPNGAIFVYRGLLEAMDDDEVALVLGHEIAHVTHEHSHEGRLPRSVPPGDGEALTWREVEVDWAEHEAAAPGHSAAQRDDSIAGTRAGGEREGELPCLVRLLGQLVALQEPLCLAHFRRKRVRRPAVLPTRLVAERRSTCARLAPPRAHEVRELAPARLRPLVLLQRSGALRSARGLEVAPAAGPEPQVPGAQLDRRDVIDGAVEELPVVRHDDERAAVLDEEPLEPFESFEVEIVRRLVEKEDVEARQQYRCERDSRHLPSGQADGRTARVDAEPEVGAHRPGARLEVVRAERHHAVERDRVAVVRLIAASERLRRLLELLLRCRHSGAAGENGEDRLARLEQPLLVEVPDGQALRSPRHRAGIRPLEPGDEPEQRRLARAVRAHEADAGLRADGERDLIEDELGAVLLADAGELDSHRRTSEKPLDDAREARWERA